MKLVGQSPLFLAATRSLIRLARFEVPVLIEGETGTGKELAARVVHYQSERRRGPFIPVNCGALPDTLVENEFFGHERGAYTDARESMPGVIALAEGGTLFLDEVNALPAKAQAALLRFLQDQRYRPLGALGERSANIRIVAATNKNLEQLVERGEFRSDLFFRIKILFVNLPPLRVAARRRHAAGRTFSRRMCAPLSPAEEKARAGDADRPRELFVARKRPRAREPDRARLPHERLSRADLEPPSQSPVPEEPLTSYAAAKAAAVADFDRRFLRELLTRAAGNVTRAAAEAGKERRALGRLVKKYGLRSHDFKP